MAKPTTTDILYPITRVRRVIMLLEVIPKWCILDIFAPIFIREKNNSSISEFFVAVL